MPSARTKLNELKARRVPWHKMPKDAAYLWWSDEERENRAAARPALSVTGVTKTQAKKAVTWLRRRNILAFYRAGDRSLAMFPTKYGAERDYANLHAAIEATRA